MSQNAYLLSDRILILDGAMGTMIQQKNLCEKDFRGERFCNSTYELMGCNDLLVLTQPQVIKDIHYQYLCAGSDIIETNSFNSNSVSMADYGLEGYVRELNREAARVAREAISDYLKSYPNAIKMVAGSIGPTNKSLSLSPDVDNPAKRSIDWDTLVGAYVEQIEGLIEGGVDLLLFETVFDTLNAKAALWAAKVAMQNMKIELPIMLSVTLTEGGRTLSGQTLEAFIASISHVKLFSIGLNCGFGAEGMLKWVELLSTLTDARICVYPNAGLPNQMGEYDELPHTMALHVKPMLDRGLINIIGGCCGTTPEHIKHITDFANVSSPRVAPQVESILRLSGFEHIDIVKERNFVNIGERCNVAGSRKFLRLINEKKYDEALSIARTQVEAGAQIIDINMDDAMLETEIEMINFLKLVASEPDVARVPLMIDSSKWNVIENALKYVQGKGIVNSISLKEGEEEFIRRATYIKEMGAAVVVMAFDEVGQADTFESKTMICQRAYNLLVNKVDFPCNDIIFDPNVLAVATGIDEHNNYGIDFINTVEWIKNNLPGAKVSGGLSNFSFSFRGNNYVREAMHSVFLYYAIAKGMDMAIVNAGTMILFDDIPVKLREAIEDVIFNRRSDATDRLIAVADEIKNGDVKIDTTNIAVQENLSATERLTRMVVKGVADDIEPVLQESLTIIGSAVGVIDAPLMSGMNEVGRLFGEGKLFLPQVVKSARIMKQAVAWLNPYIEEEKSAQEQKSAGRIVIATVKGDVHDIGKNIVTVIMRCNGFEVIDLGVMVPGEEIVKEAIKHKADIIALSGLITPSLEEMRRVAELMNEQGLSLPLMIGGATTTPLHTAVKIAPSYTGIVVHTRDAAMMPAIAQQLINNKEVFSQQLKVEQQNLRDTLNNKKELLTLEDARKKAFKADWDNYNCVEPQQLKIENYPIRISDAKRYINWRPFFSAWKLDASFAEISKVSSCQNCRANWLTTQGDNIKKATEALQLYKEAVRAVEYLERVANESITACFRAYKAHSNNDDIILSVENGEVVIPTLRQQRIVDTTYSLSDFISPMGNDYLATFAVTIGLQIDAIIKNKQDAGDDYIAMLYQTVSDRLVEAATEFFHERVRKELWGYSPNEEGSHTTALRQHYQGIRPAVGYPSLPDQSIIFDIDTIMPLSNIGITITENGAMSPASSVCGVMISHPDSIYFHIGEIAHDQRTNYAQRRATPLKDIDKWLSV